MAVIEIVDDSWTDCKTNGAASEFLDKTAIGTLLPGMSFEDYVGVGNDFNPEDIVDYKEFTLNSAAKLSFNITSTDAVKFTIFSLVYKKGTFSRKALQSISLSKAGSINTKHLLLDKSTYYIGIESTNAKKGGSANYTISLNNSVFYTQGDNSDDWTNVKTAGSNAHAELCRLGEINRMTNTITIGSGDKANWVGFSDAVDYAEFSLERGAKLSFNITADDAVKFTIYSLVQDRKGNYSLKSLQSSTLKLNKTTGRYSIDTKDLLLTADAGPYYIGVQSTNAKKGGSAEYFVSLNDNSVFFNDADSNTSDDWLYDKKSRVLNKNVGDGGVYEDIKADGWVGFGDAADYYKFDLTCAGNLSFNISSSDAAKFTIWSITEGKDRNGNTTYSMKSLQSTALKLDKATGKYIADTKYLLLDDTENVTCYYSIESTNAKKGGNAEYSVSLNDNSVFFNDADSNTSDDWLYDKKSKVLNKNVGDGGVYEDIKADGWVGFGDAADYYKFDLTYAGNLSFNISSSDAAKFTIWSITEGKDRNGNTTYSMKSLQSTALKLDKATGKYIADTKYLLLDDAENVTCYYSIESTNAKKGGNASYQITLNDPVFYTRGDNGNNDWLYDNKNKNFNQFLVQAGCISSDTPLQISGDDAWVGFGDEFDYYSFSVADDMDVSFGISATDAVKFTVYQVINGRVRSLQSTTVKAGETVSSKKLTLLSGGEYYFGIQSTNAKKGGNAEYSISASEYISPLNVTISGIKDSLFDEYDDVDTGCGCTWEDYEYHYNNCIPAKAKAGAIKGTDGNDTVTFAPNVSRYYDGIDLGKGDDRIIVKDSSASDNDDSEIQDIWLSDGPACISLGAGNDSLYLGSNNDLDCARIDFGKDNDILTLAAESELEAWGDEDNSGIYFGSGNDKLIGENTAYVETINIDFGDGNDCMEVKAGMEVEVRKLDFAGGYDELVLNGTMQITPYDYNDSSQAISGLEKLSGSGCIVFEGYYDVNIELDDELKDLLADTDITIVNALGWGFRGPEQELGDNTINGKHVQTLSRNNDDFDFWLCGEKVADSVEYGFTDSVDYVKFVKTSGISEMYGQIEMSYGDGSDFSCQLLNSNGTFKEDWSDAIMSDYYGLQKDISYLPNGTYYLKFSVSSDGACCGYIELD